MNRAKMVLGTAVAVLSVVGSFLAVSTAHAAAANRASVSTRTNINQNVNANRNLNINQNVNVNRNINATRNVNVDVDVHRDFRPVAAAVATAVVVGAVVRSLPPACAITTVNTVTYYNCTGVWYQPQFVGTQVTYVVVNAPR